MPVHREAWEGYVAYLRAKYKREDILKAYQEALDEFLAAAKMNPRSPLAANNVGFLYFKLNKVDQAIQWTEKAIAIDPESQRRLPQPRRPFLPVESDRRRPSRL
jgi:tetratricopeptide (TPR) repeat protein